MRSQRCREDGNESTTQMTNLFEMFQPISRAPRRGPPQVPYVARLMVGINDDLVRR